MFSISEHTHKFQKIVYKVGHLDFYINIFNCLNRLNLRCPLLFWFKRRLYCWIFFRNTWHLCFGELFSNRFTLTRRYFPSIQKRWRLEFNGTISKRKKIKFKFLNLHTLIFITFSSLKRYFRYNRANTILIFKIEHSSVDVIMY